MISGLGVLVAELYAASVPQSRETDAALFFSELAVIGCLLFGLLSGASAIFRRQRLLGFIGVSLCVLSAVAWWFVARHFMSPF
jgi:hypothetical protein